MNKTIRLGHIGLSFHAASAAVVQCIIERHGYTVINSASPHELMFQRYGAGEVDMLVSAWLPASHGAYLAPYLAQTRMLTVLYEPYCIWGVPAYLPDDINSVHDLLRPDVAAHMSKLIQGINPGAGISRFSRQMITAYELDRLGYHFENGTEEDCFRRYEEAVAAREWVIVPLWHPQFLHYSLPMRELSEPLGLLGGHDQATLIAREECVVQLPASLLAELRALTIGNRAVSELDYLICREGLTAVEAAQRWLARQPS